MHVETAEHNEETWLKCFTKGWDDGAGEMAWQLRAWIQKRPEFVSQHPC